jgi:hypothetical protein
MNNSFYDRILGHFCFVNLKFHPFNVRQSEIQS